MGKNFRIGFAVAVTLSMIFALNTAAKAGKYSKQGNPEESQASAAAPAQAPASQRTNVRVAIYPVRTDGFSLNQSEVTEISRLAMQACFDAGLRCSGRGETVGNVEREQRYEGRGKIAQSQYVAEFTLVGKTQDKVKLGLPGNIPIGGGYGVDIGGAVVGGGLYTNLSGIGVKMDGMELAGQISDTSDGALVYSATKSKLAMRGSFIIGEAGGSNAKKLLKTFRDIFEDFKTRVQ